MHSARIGDFGRASRPHRSHPLGPERLSSLSRVRGAAKPGEPAPGGQGSELWHQSTLSQRQHMHGVDHAVVVQSRRRLRRHAAARAAARGRGQPTVEHCQLAARGACRLGGGGWKGDASRSASAGDRPEAHCKIAARSLRDRATHVSAGVCGSDAGPTLSRRVGRGHERGSVAASARTGFEAAPLGLPRRGPTRTG